MPLDRRVLVELRTKGYQRPTRIRATIVLADGATRRKPTTDSFTPMSSRAAQIHFALDLGFSDQGEPGENVRSDTIATSGADFLRTERSTSRSFKRWVLTSRHRKSTSSISRPTCGRLYTRCWAATTSRRCFAFATGWRFACSRYISHASMDPSTRAGRQEGRPTETSSSALGRFARSSS